jgi:hypothetical protein
MEATMADQLSVGEWRTFLQARIRQEQGKDADALPVFESLLAAHPRNPHLLASRTFALARMRQGEDAAASHIDSEYTQAGQTLVGDNDKPDQWEAKLTSLLEKLDQGERDSFRTAGAALAMVW